MRVIPIVLALLPAVAWARTHWKDHHESSDLSQGPGLAAKFLRDQGIASHPDVVFHEDFEGSGFGNWGQVKAKTTVLETESANVNSGRQAVRMTATLGKDTGGNLVYWFKQGGLNRCFARFYVKFAADIGYVHHFVHLNGGVKKWSSFGKAGLRPAGSDFFSSGIEPAGHWGRVEPPGAWMFYSYWHEMEGAPGGKYWGNGMWPEPRKRIDRDRWICMEIMLKMNDVGQRNGEQAVWQDGKLIGHFKGISWRTDEKLKVNVFWLLFYVTPNAARQNHDKTPPQIARVWFDDVVVAKQYIGPLATQPPVERKAARPVFAPVILPHRRPRPGDPLAAHAGALDQAERLAREGRWDEASARYREIARELETGAAKDRIGLRLEGIAARPALIEMIVKGVQSWGSKQVYIDFAGHAQRARLVVATDRKATFALKGSEIPLAWASLSPTRLAGIASKYAAAAPDRLAIAKFLLACGQVDGARGQIERLRTGNASAEQTEQARRIEQALP